ncbi:hypothetical protein KO525_07395 [Psychrosphaera sp. B3R10]|uniref:hypothetical protein n=1 Tax=unclassified Psychrosphaera TaxID=2641570 RepID=UPI001C09F4DF|nr:MULTISPECIES: hypothetical protein [unclassified Psychrosphaera]MBU2881835.1 hypothetical protein [Psychrosphaera sp. I2R16]MBU2989193.1 hypothetical protein [Psychrosphaera sp. B3R10]MDO6719991.1 hypothetical protein [Psychrosphaera sp. 1_MG-2023]
MIKLLLTVTLAKYLNSAIMFLIPVLLPKYLNEVEMGMVATYQSLFTLLVPLIGVNTASYLLRFYDGSEKRTNLIIYSSIIIILAALLSVLAVLNISYPYIREIIQFPLLWTAITAFSVCIWQVLFLYITLMQVKLDAKNYSITILVRSLAIVFCLYILLNSQVGWQSRVLSVLLADVLIVLVFLFAKKVTFSLKIRNGLRIAKLSLNYCLPLVPHTLAMWVLFSIDIFFINYYLGLEYSAVYFIGNIFALVIGILQDAIISVITPIYFQRFTAKLMSKKDFIIYLFVFFTFLAVSSFIVYLISPYVLWFLYGEDYAEATTVIPYLLAGFVFNGIYKYVAIIIFYIKRTKFMILCSSIAAITNIFLNYKYIEDGIVGISISTSISFFISFMTALILIYYQTKKLNIFSVKEKVTGV